MEDSTLFVLPPSPAFLCPIHEGILQSPVINACGHSFCQDCVSKASVCPVDHVPLKDCIPNSKFQVDIDSLLCYCKFGVMRGSDGNLIPNPKGCSSIVKYCNRLLHEATCDFHEKDFIFIDSPPTSPSDTDSPLLPSISQPKQQEDEESLVSSVETPKRMMLIPCPNKDYGCFFLAESDEELAGHLSDECSYERLRNQLRVRDDRISLLEQELFRRDEEILILRQQLEEQKTAFIQQQEHVDPPTDIWEEILKIFGEEIPNGLNSARNSFVRSNAFQKSSTTLSSIKSKFSRKTETMKQELNELHPLDKLIAVLSSIKDELVSSLKESMVKNPQMLPSSSQQDPDVKASIEAEKDPVMKKHLEASLETYEAEKQARLQLEAFEAAAIAAAAAQSLAEQAEAEEEEQSFIQVNPEDDTKDGDVVV